MRSLLRLPGRRSVSFVIAFYIVLIVLVLLWARQVLGVVTRNDPAQAPALLAISLLFPVAFIVLSAVSLFRVLAQRKAGVAGAVLRLRLIGHFSLVVLVTALPLGLLATLFLNTSLDMWLAPGNGRALDAGEELAMEYHSDALRNLGSLAESEYLGVLVETDAELSTTWAALKDVAPWLGSMQVFKGNKNRQWGDPRLFVSADDLDAFSSQGALPRRIGNEQTALTWQVFRGDYRIVLSASLPSDFEQDVRALSLAKDEWKRYVRMRGGLGGSLAIFGVYLAGPLVLMALLIGMALSDRVLRPMVALGEATRKISEGDFSFRVLSSKEDELAFLTDSFNMMIRELESSRTKLVQTEQVSAWQVIAQRLAHELRNPLTPIKLSAQRMQRKALEDRLDPAMVGKSMELILKEVDGLDKLLQDFREFAGGGPPKKTPQAMRSLLEEIIERFKTVSPNVEWTLVSGPQSHELPVDELQMRQVLVNLLKNAMEAGATKIACRLDAVQRGTTPYCRIQIRDDGEGIEPERSSAIFQPYDSSRDRGSGLGLAVAQRIIYDHQGRIWFDSELGVGTVFYIDLPVGEAS